MPKNSSLKKYKEYVKERIAQLTPLLQKAAMGDFSEKVEIPLEEDEFSELLVGLNLMMDDLRQLQEMRDTAETESKEKMAELEKWKKLTTGRELKMKELKEEMTKLKEENLKLSTQRSLQ